MTTFTVVTLTDAGAITSAAGQTQADALEALRAYHASVDQIMAGAASETTPGVWFFLESRPPLTLAARQSRHRAAQPAPLPKLVPPVIAPPGAKFMRRVAELDQSPGRALAGKTARQIEHIIDTMGDRIRPSSLAAVLRMHTTAVELEAQEEADAAAAEAAKNVQDEAPASQPGAKILRRRAAEEAARLEAEEAARLEAEAAADPERQFIAKLNELTSLTEIAEHVHQLSTDDIQILACNTNLREQAAARLWAIASARKDAAAAAAAAAAFHAGLEDGIRASESRVKPNRAAKAKKTAVEAKEAPPASDTGDTTQDAQGAKKA